MATAAPISLSQVMDEELALKLQQEEERAFQAQIAMALRLSAASAADEGIAAPTPSSSSSSTTPSAVATATPVPSHEEDELLAKQLEAQLSAEASIDDDYALAAQLQARFDVESEAIVQQARSRQSGAKVAVSYEKHLLPDSAKYGGYHGDEYDYELDSDDDDNDDSDDTDSDNEHATHADDAGDGRDAASIDGDDSTSKSSNGGTGSNEPHANSSRKPKGRLPCAEYIESVKKAKGIVTKHDPVVAGYTNASSIEHFSAATGNIGGGDLAISTPVYNSLRQFAQQSEASRIRLRGRQDIATVEGVMDARTRLILYKMLNAHVFESVSGIVSTGKEANVYYGEGADGRGCAIKIYRTTQIEFKHRDIYIRNDSRFKHKASQHNPRKLIALWAEKEWINLNKLQKCRVPCPATIELRKNVLVMEFLGKDGVPAPKLRDVPLDADKLCACYRQCVHIMRQLYQTCRLVHADLSEYNILYYKGSPWIIDVAQAVENDDPNALQFLRRDCETMTAFFTRSGLLTAMSPRELFEYITDLSITPENEDEYLERMQERILSRGEQTPEQIHQSNIFMQSFIPRVLAQVSNPELELESVKNTGTADEVYHRAVTGLNQDLSGAKLQPEILNDDESSSTSSSQGDHDDDDDDVEDEDDELLAHGNHHQPTAARPSLSKEQQKQVRKLAKKEFKRKQRERRAMKHGHLPPPPSDASPVIVVPAAIAAATQEQPLAPEPAAAAADSTV